MLTRANTRALIKFAAFWILTAGLAVVFARVCVPNGSPIDVPLELIGSGLILASFIYSALAKDHKPELEGIARKLQQITMLSAEDENLAGVSSINAIKEACDCFVKIYKQDIIRESLCTYGSFLFWASFSFDMLGDWAYILRFFCVFIAWKDLWNAMTKFLETYQECGLMNKFGGMI